MPDKIVEELVSNVLETQFDSFDEAVVDHAKDRIIDVVGCIIAGANAPGCSMIIDLVRKWGGKGESTILVHGGRAPAHNVAMMNGIMARSVDFEPLSPYIDGRLVHGHICGTTVPTAITVAEQKAVGGKDLITALVVGDDLASRLLAASRFSFHTGWMGSGMCNTFGAAAIAGRLNEVNECQMLNAFGIVVNQLGSTVQAVYDGVHSFKLPQGLAGRAGVFSVELASNGFTGVKDPLLSRYGYFPLYCQEYNLEILTKELGREFYADSTFKLYPSCRGNHAAIECILDIINKHDIKTEDVKDIAVNVSPAVRDFIGKPFEIGDVPQVNAIYSLRYNVANTLLRKDVKLEHFTEEFIRNSKVIDLTKKVEINAITVPPNKPWATDVKIKMRNGTEFSAHVEVPKGDPVSNPLTRAEIKEKFRANVAFSKTVAKENGEKVLNMIERLEEVDDTTEVVNLLVA